jgi:CHAD domain-containing protein
MAKAAPVALHPDLPYREAAARTVEVRAQELFDHAEGVLDTADIERVHDMRVATRRLRAALEIFEPCFAPKQFKPALRDVKRLADALGARRDPDVQLEALEQLEAALGDAERPGLEVLAEELRAEQAEGNERLAAALAEADTADLSGRIAALAAGARG